MVLLALLRYVYMYMYVVYPILKDLTVALAVDYYRQAFQSEQQMIDMQTSTNTLWHN